MEIKLRYSPKDCRKKDHAMKSKSEKIMILGNKYRLSSIWMIKIPERENWEATEEKIIKQIILKCFWRTEECVFPDWIGLIVSRNYIFKGTSKRIWENPKGYIRMEREGVEGRECRERYWERISHVTNIWSQNSIEFPRNHIHI